MRRTDEMTVTFARVGVKPVVFTLPVSIGRKVESLVRKSAKAEKSVPVAAVFPELLDDVLRPATVLRGSRHKENLTQKELAALLGMRQSHLSEIENGKRPIGKGMAKKLAEIFDCDYRTFL